MFPLASTKLESMISRNPPKRIQRLLSVHPPYQLTSIDLFAWIWWTPAHTAQLRWCNEHLGKGSPNSLSRMNFSKFQKNADFKIVEILQHSLVFDPSPSPRKLSNNLIFVNLGFLKKHSWMRNSIFIISILDFKLFTYQGSKNLP